MFPGFLDTQKWWWRSQIWARVYKKIVVNIGMIYTVGKLSSFMHKLKGRIESCRLEVIYPLQYLLYTFGNPEIAAETLFGVDSRKETLIFAIISHPVLVHTSFCLDRN